MAFVHRRIGSLAVSVVAAVSVGVAPANAAGGGSTSAKPPSGSCGTLLRPDLDRQLLASDGTPLAMEPEIAVPLARGATWVDGRSDDAGWPPHAR